MLKLSIITINYNNALGLKKTISSVINQMFSDFEFIVIDGASSDSSIEVIKKYASKINYWISEKDKGIYNAQNKGISAATGEYCLFLNAGDCLVNENVLATIFLLKDSEDIIYGDMITTDESEVEKHLKMPNHIGVKRMLADTLWHPVSIIKRELFLKYGNYDEQFKIVADYEFFVRVIIKEKVTTKHVPIEITIFDTSGLSSDMSKRQQLIKERNQIQDMYFNPFLLFFFRLYSKIRN
jgi:glycosyltransferase involved in cell wall biosynthesis